MSTICCVAKQYWYHRIGSRFRFIFIFTLMLSCALRLEEGSTPLLKKIQSAPLAVKEHFDKNRKGALVITHNMTLMGVIDAAFEKAYEEYGNEVNVNVTVERYDTENSTLKKRKDFDVKNQKQFEQSASWCNAIAELQKNELLRVRTQANEQIYDFVRISLYNFIHFVYRLDYRFQTISHLCSKLYSQNSRA